MIEGQFIVLEGIDGAGTTTQASLLASAIKGRGLPVCQTREPSEGPFGSMLRQIVGGRVVVPGIQGVHAPSWAAMALLFAADRLDHLDATIVPNLMDGVTVVCDRYDHSSVAYQSVTSGDPDATAAWVGQINSHARRPDLVLVLDVSPTEAAKRRSERGHVRDIFETDELQVELARFYKNIDRFFPEDRIVHIDGDPPAPVVAEAIFQAVKELRGES